MLPTRRARGVVHHLSNQRARLAPVVLAGLMRVRGKHQVAGVPARGFAVAHGVGAWTTVGIRRVHRVGHLHVPHRAILAVAVHRRDRCVHGQLVVVRADAAPVRVRVGKHPAHEHLCPGSARCRGPYCSARPRAARSPNDGRWGCGSRSSDQPRRARSPNAATPWSRRTS
jgi:hypothetical protein